MTCSSVTAPPTGASPAAISRARAWRSVRSTGTRILRNMAAPFLHPASFRIDYSVPIAQGGIRHGTHPAHRGPVRPRHLPGTGRGGGGAADAHLGRLPGGRPRLQGEKAHRPGVPRLLD